MKRRMRDQYTITWDDGTSETGLDEVFTAYASWVKRNEVAKVTTRRVLVLG